MPAALLALVLSVLGPSPDARPIAEAIAGAVAIRAERGIAPVTESPDLDAVLLATYARHESGARIEPHPWSWDARAGLSCGPWQERRALARVRSLRWQALAWLWSVRRAGLAGVDSSASRARARLAEAREALRRALAAHAVVHVVHMTTFPYQST